MTTPQTDGSPRSTNAVVEALWERIRTLGGSSGLDKNQIATALRTAGDPLNEAVKEVGGTSTVGMSDLVAALDMKADKQLVVAFAGDSTGTEADEVYEQAWRDAMSQLWPERPARLFRWNKDGATYEPESVWQKGKPGPEIFRDSFGGPNGTDVVGSMPQVGGVAWSGNAGVWSIQNGRAVSSGSGYIMALVSNASDAPDAEWFGTIAHTGASGNRLRFHGQVINSPASGASIGIEFNGTAVTLFAAASGDSDRRTIATFPTAVPAAKSDHAVSLRRVGKNVSGTVNGTTVSGVLTDTESDAMTAVMRVSVRAFYAGAEVDNVHAWTIPDATKNMVTFYNGSAASERPAYQTERFDTLYPERPDVFFINHGHNIIGFDPDEFLGEMDSLVAALHSRWPGVPVAVLSQNPRQNPPKTLNEVTRHRAMILALREHARKSGWEYVPTYEAFEALPDSGRSLISDGVHPDVGTGRRFHADALLRVIRQHSRRYTPAFTPLSTDKNDRGLAFMQNVRFEGPVRAGLAGDSTGNATNEWFDLLIKRLGAKHTDQKYVSTMLDPTSLVYNPPVALQPGIDVGSGIKVRETFQGSPGELIGSSPTLGPSPWWAEGSNSLGDWTRDGTGGASTTSETARAAAALDMGVMGDMETRIDLTLDTTIVTAARAFRVFASYRTNADHLFGQVTISQSSGAAILSLYKRVGNTLTKINSGADPTATAILANTAGQNVTVRARREGKTFTFTVTGNGKTDTVTAELTDDDLAAVESGAKGGIAVTQSALLPIRMTLVELSLLNAAPLPEARFWNTSISGSTLAVQQPRIAELFPERLDVLFLSAGHNYKQQTPAEMFALIDSFVQDFRRLWPDTPVVITGQNPQFAPSSNAAAHNNRQKALVAYCRERGFGYVPVTAKWLEQTNKGRDLVQSDGIHPTVGDTGTGSSFWADQVFDYLNSL